MSNQTNQSNETKAFIYWRKSTVSQLTGLSLSSIYRREKEKQFPPRYKISKNIVAYRSDQILAWMAARPTVEK